MTFSRATAALLVLMALPALDGVSATEDTPADWPPVQREKVDPTRSLFTIAEYAHGAVTVRIAQLKTLSRSETDGPHFCRAWLQVLKGREVLWQRSFDDIEPVGFSYGLVVPSDPPSQDLFAVVKNGDYDGRLLLIGRDGSVIDTIGGFYFLTQDRHFLISDYASDDSGVAVVDLLKSKLLFTAERLPDIHQWYRNGYDYYFSESEWLPSNKGLPTERRGTAHWLNFQKSRIDSRPDLVSTHDHAHSVSWTLDPGKYEDCMSPSNQPLQPTPDGATERRR